MMLTPFMIVQLVLSVALIAAVLLQPSKGEGMGSIGGGGQMFFSKAKGFEAVMEKATKYLAVAFMILSVALAIFV